MLNCLAYKLHNKPSGSTGSSDSHLMRQDSDNRQEEIREEGTGKGRERKRRESKREWEMEKKVLVSHMLSKPCRRTLWQVLPGQHTPVENCVL